MNFERKIKKFAEGGAAPALDASAMPTAMPPEGNQAQIMGMLEQYAQTKDPELAIQLAEAMIVEMGIASPQDPAVTEQQPNPPALEGGAPEQVPAFKKGGGMSAVEQYKHDKNK